MRFLKEYLPILVIIFLLGGVYLGYANVWLCVAAFVIGLTRLNKEEFAFFMLLGGCEYFGVVGRILLGHFTLLPQFVCYLIVLLVIYPRIVPLFRQNRMANYLFFFLVSVFAISYLYGPQHAYSTTKLIRIAIYGLLCLWGFMLYNKSENISGTKLAYMFALAGVTYIITGVTIYHFGNPSSLFDFNYFRNHLAFDNNVDFAISYHSVGLAALYGIVFLLSNNNDRILFQKKSLILLLILFYIALISQMRQGILAIFLVLFFRFIMLVKYKVGYKFVGLLLIGIIAYFMFNSADSDAFQSVEQAKSFEEAVNRSYDKSLSIIKEYPLFGKGLGGYSDDGKVAYPHNIFLEIINEQGFVGLILVLIISLCAMRYNQFSWKATNANGSYAILLLLALFVRVNASSDLAENVYFFSLLFSIKNWKNISLYNSQIENL